jgi:hypothetical protein
MEMYDFLIDIVPKEKYQEGFINPSDVLLNDYFNENQAKKENP